MASHGHLIRPARFRLFRFQSIIQSADQSRQQSHLLQKPLVDGLGVLLALQRLQVLIDLELLLFDLFPRFFLFWHSETTLSRKWRLASRRPAWSILVPRSQR